MSIANLFTNQTQDANTEYNFRLSGATLASQLLAAGWAKTADTGQLSWGTPAAYASTNDGQSNTARVCFDGVTTSTWTSSTAPASTAQWVAYDCGLNNVFTAASYKVYFSNAGTDPAAWTFQGSNDFVSWTTLDTQAAQSAGGAAAYKNYALAAGSQAPYRYYRLLITQTVTAGSNVSLAEVQILNAGGANVAPAVFYRGSNGSTAGYEIWTMQDSLQATVPVFLKLTYGNTLNYCNFTITVQLGNGSDGAGTLTGTGITASVSLNTATGSAASNQRSAFCGDKNRFHAQMGYSSTPYLWFCVERIQTGAGADSTLGAVLVGGTGSTKTMLVMPGPGQGPAPAAETDYGCLLTTGATAVRGGNVGLAPVQAFLGSALNPMKTLFGYLNADITAEVSVPMVDPYGGTVTAFPVGNYPTNIARANSSSRIAMLFQ